MLGGDHQRRRHRAEPVRAQRRQVRVLEVGRRRGVLLPVPGGLARVEAVAGLSVRREAGGRVEERVDEDGARRTGPGAGARRRARGCPRRCRRGRTPARRARATTRLAVQPADHRRHVVRRRRESVLGRAAGSRRSARRARSGSRGVERSRRARRRRGRRSRRRARARPRRLAHRPAGRDGPGTPSASRSRTSATSSRGSAARGRAVRGPGSRDVVALGPHRRVRRSRFHGGPRLGEERHQRDSRARRPLSRTKHAGERAPDPSEDPAGGRAPGRGPRRRRRRRRRRPRRSSRRRPRRGRASRPACCPRRPGRTAAGTRRRRWSAWG